MPDVLKLCVAVTVASLAASFSAEATVQGSAIQFRVVAPAVYTANLSLGGTTLNVVADASKSPKTLTVTEPRLGCRCNAVAP
jgi:hypothetical protein